ncbi:MAG: hypothetical protein QM489_01430 [Candidatus Izemoplasma sp.]
MNCYASKIEVANTVCPNCKSIGDVVDLKTVENMVLDKSVHYTQDFLMCLTSDCYVAYFSKSVVIKTDEIKEVIYSKSIKPDRILCYCSRTKAQEILDYVDSSGNFSIKDIVKHTSAMNNSNCLVKSPTGKCCSKQINEAVKKHLD